MCGKAYGKDLFQYIKHPMIKIIFISFIFRKRKPPEKSLQISTWRYIVYLICINQFINVFTCFES